MTKTGKPDDDLNAAFTAARAHALEPDAAFLARVLDDAEAVQAEFGLAAEAETPDRARVPRGWRGVFRALGGWPAMAGLSAAMITGLWIGVAPPESLSTTAQMVLGEEITLAFEPDLGTELFPEEGG